MIRCNLDLQLISQGRAGDKVLKKKLIRKTKQDSMETFIGMHVIGHERPETFNTIPAQTFFKMHWTLDFDNNNNKYLRTRSPRMRIKEVCDKVNEK